MRVAWPEPSGGLSVRVGDGFTGYSVLAHLVGATLPEKGDVEISLQLSPCPRRRFSFCRSHSQFSGVKSARLSTNLKIIKK